MRVVINCFLDEKEMKELDALSKKGESRNETMRRICKKKSNVKQFLKKTGE